VFVYNKTKPVASALPHSLLDLADPVWKGRWAASPTGADFQTIASALLELKGETPTLAWLKAMKANSVASRGNGAVLKAVNSGQIEAGVIYHYYYFRDQAKTGENSGSSALYYFKDQDPGAFVSISGGGVLASSKHLTDGHSFLKWVTGPAGQAVLRNGDAYEYVVGEGEASNPKLTPLTDLDAPQIDVSKLNSKKVVQLMTQAGLLGSDAPRWWAAARTRARTGSDSPFPGRARLAQQAAHDFLGWRSRPVCLTDRARSSLLRGRCDD
jgi:iron(III) transport system substrate-binding protein